MALAETGGVRIASEHHRLDRPRQPAGRRRNSAAAESALKSGEPSVGIW